MCERLTLLYSSSSSDGNSTDEDAEEDEDNLTHNCPRTRGSARRSTNRAGKVQFEALDSEVYIHILHLRTDIHRSRNRTEQNRTELNRKRDERREGE